MYVLVSYFRVRAWIR